MTRKLKIVFVISLLLNVLLLGVLGGHAYKRMTRQHHGAQLEEALKDLPAESAERIRSQLKVMFTQFRQHHKERKKERSVVLRLLASEPFDKAAYLKQVEALHQNRGVLMQKFAIEIATLAETLNQQERSALAEALQRPPKRRHYK